MKMWYFSYGSNMSIEKLKKRGIKTYNFKSGILYDYKIVFNKKETIIHLKSSEKEYLKYRRLWANIEYCKGSKTEGTLFEIDEDQLKIIDYYEGYPLNYIRKNIKIVCKDEIIEAITYISVKSNTIHNNDLPDYEIDDEYKKQILKSKTIDKQYKNKIKNENKYILNFDIFKKNI